MRAALSALIAVVLLCPTTVGAADMDFAVQNGWYFSQAGGYSITNDGGVTLWRDFQRLGGVRTLGYPSSWRFVGPDGFIYQATQAALLQWNAESERAVLANTFDILSEASKDDWLKTARAIPQSVGEDGSHGDPTRSMAIRMSWLEDEGIRDYYLSNPNPAEYATWTQQQAMQLYGLPTSRPLRSGPFVAQRFQRVALQRWVEAIPGMPPPGSVVRVLGGDLFKEAGLMPPLAVTAAPHDSLRGRIDPDLMARLNLLGELEIGEQLRALAIESPLAFVWTPLPQGTDALFSGRGRWIAVNLAWRNADPRSVAALLGHEMSHVRDVLRGRTIWTTQGCLETEQDAFVVQGRIWEAFFGPRGKRLGVLSEIDQRNNRILEALRTEPEAFAARIVQSYQHDCGLLSG